MNAYLSLTLADAHCIIARNERKHWVEARKVVELTKSYIWGSADDPDYVVVTFVHRFGASNKTADKLVACTGQVIVVLARDHQRAPRLIWGKPLHSGDALLRDVQRNHILSTVRQPRA